MTELQNEQIEIYECPKCGKRFRLDDASQPYDLLRPEKIQYRFRLLVIKSGNIPNCQECADYLERIERQTKQAMDDVISNLRNRLKPEGGQ